jgi:hypothetical protein
VDTEVSLKVVFLNFLQVAFPCSTAANSPNDRPNHTRKDCLLPNVFFSVEVTLVVSLLPELPVLVKARIECECAAESECEHGENRDGLHLRAMKRKPVIFKI